MPLFYNDKDITSDISIMACYHQMRAWGGMDELHVTFSDDKGIWDQWAPAAGDRIRVTDGPTDTGVMYVRRVRPMSGSYEISAYPAPQSVWTPKARSWNQVHLLQLISQIASDNGLSFETYGVDDQLYTHVEQRNTPDIVFLNKRITLEGANMVVFNGKLIVYDGLWAESQAPADSYTLFRDVEYELKDDQMALWDGCEVTDGTTSATFRLKSGKELKKVVDLTLSSQEEAARFARGALREANREARSMVIEAKNLLTKFAAGSVMDLKVYFSSSWDGKALIYRIRNDYVRNRSKIWLTKPLGAY